MKRSHREEEPWLFQRVCAPPVIVCVRHDDLLLHPETEAVRGVELPLARPQLAELASGQTVWLI